MPSRTEDLLNTVRTRQVIGYKDHGDMEHIPVYNTPERIEAADKLANTNAIEALPTIQDLFVEGICTLNLLYDADNKGFHHFTYPSELRRLTKALLHLGGTEAFSRMMVDKVLPLLEDADSTDNRRCLEGHISKKKEALSFLRSQFGSIGDWEQESSTANQEKRKLQHLCVMCGRQLTLFDRLLKREKHSSCNFFTKQVVK